MTLPVAEISSMTGIDATHETTRRNITYVAICGFILLLAAMVVGGWLVLRISADEMLKVLTATASVLSGVVGAIIGFYFQTKA